MRNQRFLAFFITLITISFASLLAPNKAQAFKLFYKAEDKPKLISLTDLDQNLNQRLTVKVKEAKSEEIKTVKATASAVKPFGSGYAFSTAYSSTVDQTDGSPCITASGLNVCEFAKKSDMGVVAANWLKFGTKIRIPDYFGAKIFVVEDRMNQRYPNRLDIWFPSRGEALRFGARMVRYEIVK